MNMEVEDALRDLDEIYVRNTCGALSYMFGSTFVEEELLDLITRLHLWKEEFKLEKESTPDFLEELIDSAEELWKSNGLLLLHNNEPNSEIIVTQVAKLYVMLGQVQIPRWVYVRQKILQNKTILLNLYLLVAGPI